MSDRMNPGEVRHSMNRWRQAMAVYTDRRILLIAFMGFSSGLPLLLTLSTLSYWLAKLGVSKTSIGLFALVGTPYSFKFLWAPFLDQIRPPFLGRRRGWALIIQLALALAILAMGMTDPAFDPWWTALAVLVVAFLSASQDIVIDAYRIEILPEALQGAGAAATQVGYRFGLLAAGAGAVALADFVAWHWVFASLALLMAVGMATMLLAPEPAMPAAIQRQSLARRLEMGVIEPFLDFLGRRGWLVILLFVLLYKFGEAVSGTMATPFYVELGFTGVEIAEITKIFGIVASLAGTLAGGLMVARVGIMRALFLGGVLQAAGILLFAVLAYQGHDRLWLAIVVGSDNFVSGLGSAAFVAYLSALCNVAFTGTQYALLTSFMAWGRTLLSSGSGWLAVRLGWPVFFIASTGLAVPGLLLLLWLSRLYPTPRAGMEAKLA
ncbi:MAG TPA: MFS transporter [Candidatus Udaeobacter sp.]|nr:MFS transporter [Candidatus Udaeobacter sp.]